MAKRRIEIKKGFRAGQLEVIRRADVANKESYVCICHACGNEIVLRRAFLTSQNRRSCGCLNKGAKGKGTLCWSCENSVPRIEDGIYTRGCNWSINKKPVEGWEAEPRTLRHNGVGLAFTKSFHVISCPQYSESRKGRGKNGKSK